MCPGNRQPATDNRQLKNMNTKLLYTLLFILTAALLPAQNFPFYQEDFGDENDGNQLPAGWTTEDVSDNFFPTRWERCIDFTDCPPATLFFTIAEDFLSTTAQNGYVYAASQSDPDTAHVSFLTSPLIAVPAETGSLFLEYQSFLYTLHTREHEGTRLEVQADGGVWQSFFIYPETPNTNSGQPQRTHNANVFLTDLSDFADAENIRLRWRWTGAEELVWALDDVKIFDYNPLSVRAVWSNGDFDGGLNEWTINTLDDAECGWEFQPYGSYGDALLPAGNDNKFINSPTAQNGAVVVNGDACYTNDEPPTFSLDLFPNFVTELISPVIDLSATTDRLVLDYYQTARKFGITSVFGSATPFYLSFSHDGGATWGERVRLNESISFSTDTHNRETVLLPEELIGAAQARFKFIFDGKLFYWGIDDVRILERADYDLRISPDFFAVPPSYAVPAGQVDSIPFMADVENFGKEIQTDVRLLIEIENTETEEIMHRDTVLISEMQPLELVENILFPTAWLPPAEPATYRGRYTVESPDNLEDVPENNVVAFDFAVTERAFAKEKRATFGFTPPRVSYRWGNVFYVPQGENYVADSIYFGIENVADLEGESVQTEVYEWLNNPATPLQATPEEYTLIANNVYFITGDEEGIIGIPVDFTGEQKSLTDDRHYMVVIRFEQPTGSPQLRCFLSSSQERDYVAMYVASDLRQDLRFATVTDLNLTGIFDVVGVGNGSGFNIVPQIRLTVLDPTVETENPVAAEQKIRLLPNPTRGEFTILLPGQMNGEITIFDTDAKSILTQKVQNGRAQVDISELPHGVYFVRFTDENGREFAEKLVKF